jgi:N-methylhydantoinase B
MLLTGRDPATGRGYTNIEPVAGGWGARPHGDGPGSTYTIGHGDTFNVPIEVLETRFPLMIERYQLRQDSGGAGRWRGGLGLERVYRVLDNGLLNGLTARSISPPWGLQGGKQGATGTITVRRRRSRRIERYQKVTGLVLGKDDEFTFLTGGGGGYGDPLERDAGQVASDVATGHISAKAARADYGVVLDRSSGNVNIRETQKLRGRVRTNKAKSRKPKRKSAHRYR